MKRIVSCPLVMLSLCTTAWAQVWSYQSFEGARPVAQGSVTLHEPEPGRLRMRFDISTIGRCYRGELAAAATLQAGVLTVVTVPPAAGCEEMRFELRLDGSAGSRSTRFADSSGWALDPRDHGLRFASGTLPASLQPAWQAAAPAVVAVPVADANAVPYLNEAGRDGYRKWLANRLPRAFALAENGRWYSSSGTRPPNPDDPADPAARALLNCERSAKQPCRLYAQDNAVVWDRRIESPMAVARGAQLASAQAAAPAAATTTAEPAPAQSALPATPGTRRALVIGNNAYRHVSKLETAVADARDMAAQFTALGYRVTLRTDVTDKDLKATLRAFKAEVQPGDEVAIFYAGHGVQLGAANFLLPVDIQADGEDQVRDDAVPLDRILDDMAQSKARFTLALVDACRDNPFKGTTRSVGMSRGLAPTTAATGQMVVYSAGAGQRALDRLGPSDTSRNGLFTRVFLREMTKPNVTVDQLVRNVRNQVVGMAKTVGHEQVPAIYDQVVGEFYLRR